MKKLVLTFALLVLASCAVPIAVTTDFNEQQARQMLEEGDYTISGNALFRQVSGRVVPCAGEEVLLVPVTDYASERINIIYGNTTRGYAPVRGKYPKEEDKAKEALYFQLSKTVFCDAVGNFKFTKMKNGEYFVTTKVIWYLPDDIYRMNPQGGFLMQRVNIQDESVEIVLTPRR
jgi:hypothetical protein